jgi:hypothetical protein
MNVNEIYQEINAKHPNLVENLLDRSSRESESERQTIYGDLMDWLRDYYTIIPLYDRSTVANMLIGQYVIKHPYCLQKIYIVKQESNVDGELLFNATPCRTLEAAQKVMSDEIRTIMTESHHFGWCKNLSTLEKEYEVEKDDTSFYLNDPSDDYYEDIKIEEKIILS